MSKGKARVSYVDADGDVRHRSAPSWDFLYQASTTKDPEWDVGDRVVLPDGRVFRYGKAGADLEGMKWGVKNWSLLVTELDAIATATVAGATSIDVTLADTDVGEGGVGVFAKDELRGGYISIYRGTVRQQRGIIGNTVRAHGDTDNTRIYLDAALVTAIEEDDNVEILGNPYINLRQGSNTNGAVMGMPTVLAESGQYFWIQTWGICRVTPNAAELGALTTNHQFVFDGYGSVASHLVDNDTGTSSYQHAGFIVEMVDGGAGSAAPFINLQINP